ncbi:MAG: UDP-N-acetylmuramate:L-alanyl-gamma-D-glutamyl-meso-diaminopimelate ligase, partial [Aeromonadaceae bacterium]|nr:UDP-N-acetylmuramate:L-alanyl-gamma-D-glutamyl-meso-diaminopimelate ligase [Aeromonadaceae bacterium]
GRLLVPSHDSALDAVLKMGCWSEVERVDGDGAHWQAKLLTADGSRFEVWLDGSLVGELNWCGLGQHNVHNALMAIAAARHAGVLPADAVSAMSRFVMPKRRMELKGEANGVKIYDDFAHHPTAIETTLGGLRAKVGQARILAVLEPRSNTMKLGVHQKELSACLARADKAYLFAPSDLGWDIGKVAAEAPVPTRVFHELSALVDQLAAEAKPGDQILVMSNGGFGGIHGKLLARLHDVAGV